MSFQMKSAQWSSLIRWAGWTAIILLPALITTVMILQQYTCCYLPGFNDEVSQWHQIKTFSEAGFQGGYYTWNEKPAKLPFVHFGNWGPGFPALFGSLGKLFGWHPDSAIYYNTTVLTLALVVLVFVTRPAPRQTALLMLLFATFWPVLLYVPRTMQMTLHVSFAILFATLFHQRIALRHRAGSTNICFSLLLAVAATVQFTWMLIVFPWLLTRPGVMNGRQVVIRIVSAVGLNVLGAAYFLSMVPPYASDNAGDVIRAAQVGMKPVVDLVLPRFLYIARLRGDVFESILWVQCALLLSIVTFLARHWINVKLRTWATSSPKLLVTVLLGVFAAALFVCCAALDFQRGRYFVIPLVMLLYPVTNAFIGRLQNNDSPRPPAVLIDSYLLVAGVSVVLAVGISVLFGYPDEHRAYRFVAPYLLLGCLMLILGKRVQAALIVIAVAGAGVPGFFSYYNQQFGKGSWFSKSAMANTRKFERQIQPYLAFNQGAGPWCNTLLFEVGAFQPPLVTVPPGMGLSFIYSVDNAYLKIPLRSKYVLVGPKIRKLLEERGARLSPLTATVLGDLYINADARCSQ